MRELLYIFVKFRNIKYGNTYYLSIFSNTLLELKDTIAFNSLITYDFDDISYNNKLDLFLLS